LAGFLPTVEIGVKEALGGVSLTLDMTARFSVDMTTRFSLDMTARFSLEMTARFIARNDSSFFG